MITKIEVQNFRCLKDIKQTLEPFHILIGPNASGKTTFLDTLAFLKTHVEKGPLEAVYERTSNFQDLTWMRNGEQFSIAIELTIPEVFCQELKRHHQAHNTVRYQIVIGQDADEKQRIGVQEETVSLYYHKRPGRGKPSKIRPRKVVGKLLSGKANFYPEFKGTKKWINSYNLGPQRSALGNLPEDEELYPVAIWLKKFLIGGVQSLVLNSLKIRQASPPGQGRDFKLDGSNLPWVIDNLQHQAPERFERWIAHLRTALPGLTTIHTIEREDDKHRYLILTYENGLEAPSWLVSDGTLRLLALTLPAYLPVQQGIYLIEEPENGIHPRAVEAVFQSLSSVYEAQVLIASHSLVLLNVAEPRQLLCFSRTDTGEAHIIAGHQHPALQKWQKEIGLGMLFAAGVLE